MDVLDHDQVARDQNCETVGLFAGYLRRLRQAALLTQEELAFKAGLSPRAVQQMEGNRVRHPRRESVRLLANALGLTGGERARFEAVSRRPAPRRDAATGAVAGRSPAQLPPDIADFVGRHAETGVLTRWVTSPGQRRGLPIVSLQGAAGVGKTALATHVGHLVRPAFPDGQLYADLGGLRRPVGLTTVLARLLRALGVDRSPLPSDVDELAEMFRTATADRRILLVLDDVPDPDYVLPLLPGTASCAVMLTSRADVAGIHPARHVSLEPLDDAEAAQLFGHIVGQERVRADPVSARSVVRWCAGLPLALRTTGALLAGRRAPSLAWLVNQLGDDGTALDRLGSGESGLRGRLSASYRALTPAARSAFRRMGLLPKGDYPASTVAALLQTPVCAAQAALDELTVLHLLDAIDDRSGAAARYRLHDLVRLYAAECAAGRGPGHEPRSSPPDRAFSTSGDRAIARSSTPRKGCRSGL